MDGSSSPISPPSPSTPPLDERLRDDDPSVRYRALDDLRDKASPRVMARAAAPLLADPDPGLREQASRLLVTLQDAETAAREVAPYIHHDNIATRNLAGEVLVELGAPAVPALVPFLRHDDHDARKFAIDVLAQLPAGDVADDIAAALDDPDANVRLAAVDALGALQATDHVEALAALYDREPLARPDILHAMGAFDAAADLDLLERGLQDDRPVVQLAAAEALASQDAPEVIGLLLDQLDAVDPMARPIVVHSIVALCTRHPQHQDALPDAFADYLIEMLGDTDDTYRCAAAQGLQWFPSDARYTAMLAHAGQSDELDMALFTTLLTHEAPLRPLRRAAADGTMPLPVATTFAVGLLARDALSESAYAPIGTFLQQHFDTLSTDDKITTVGLCQQLGRSELAPILTAAQADPNPQVQALAADATSNATPDASSPSDPSAL